MRTAIYPGSFDPITNGHIDILKRARALFDFVYVSVIYSQRKSSLFTLDERVSIIKDVFKDDEGVIAEGFKGLLIEYARTKQVYTMIRGLRAVSDFDYEFQLALTNRKIENKMNTVFFMTDEKYSYLSSSIVKELAGYNLELDQFVPISVAEALKNKLGNGAIL